MGKPSAGSVARGDRDETSDIDLLVLGTEPLTPGHFRHLLTESVQDRVSVSYYVPAMLDAYLDRWSRFAVHLRTEGQILVDRHGLLRAAVEAVRPVDTDFELRVQLVHLESVDHLTATGAASFSRWPLSTATAGPSSSPSWRNRASAPAGGRRRRQDRGRASALFLLTKGRLQPEDVPFSYVGCADKAAEAIRAVRRLVQRSQHAARFAD